MSLELPRRRSKSPMPAPSPKSKLKPRDQNWGDGGCHTAQQGVTAQQRGVVGGAGWAV